MFGRKDVARGQLCWGPALIDAPPPTPRRSSGKALGTTLSRPDYKSFCPPPNSPSHILTFLAGANFSFGGTNPHAVLALAPGPNGVMKRHKVAMMGTLVPPTSLEGGRGKGAIQDW